MSAQNPVPPRDPLAVLAEKVADALKLELRFPYPVSNQYKDFTLYDEPPPRKEVHFQKKEGEDAPKKVLAGEIASDAELEELFCMVHGEFVRHSGVDIEHGMAFKEIKESQKRFLDFLNDPRRKRFADFFLKQSGMSDFFRRDAKSGKIKGTGYFYKMCYNNISNLWLVCHACNIEKSDDNALDWFKEQKYFGQPFVDLVNKKGGLNTGVIFDIVGGTGITQLPIGKNGMRIAYSGGVGIGQAAKEWFMQVYGYVYQTHKQFYTQHYQHI